MTWQIRAENVCAYRYGKPLFQPASFSVGLGECLLVKGANGSGKTTLLDCIAGLHHDWTGRIVNRARDVSYLQPPTQYVRTLPLSRLARLVVGFKEDRYQALVEQLGLASRADVLFALLSGGELQRARLALALLRRHAILLLDEPFANVDERSSAAIREVLETTRQQRATVIVTHPRDAQAASIAGSASVVITT